MAGAGFDLAGRLAGFQRPAAVAAGLLLILWGLAKLAAAAGIGRSATAAPAGFQRLFTRAIARLRGQAADRARAHHRAPHRAPALRLAVRLRGHGGEHRLAAPGGALVMAAFWAGTVPVLAGVGALAQRAAGPLRARLPVLTAALLVVLGVADRRRASSSPPTHPTRRPRRMTTISPPDRAGAATALRALRAARAGGAAPTGRASTPSAAAAAPPRTPSSTTAGSTDTTTCRSGGRPPWRPAASPSRSSTTPPSTRCTCAPGPTARAETELYLDGVHCASCVWLVERVPLLVPGVLRAELEVGRALAHVAWNPASTSLSAIARFLDTLGYRPHPFRAQRVEERRRAEDRTAMLRIGVAGALAGNVMMLAVALYSGWFAGMEPAFVRYFRWLSLLLTAPVLIWPGRVFFQGALASLPHPPAAHGPADRHRARRRLRPRHHEHRHRHRSDLLRRRRHAGVPAAGGPLPAAARPARGDGRHEPPARAHPLRGAHRGGRGDPRGARRGAPAGRAGRGARRRDLPGRRDGGGGRVPRGPLTPDRRIAAGRRLAGGEGLGRHRQPGGGAPGDGDAERRGEPRRQAGARGGGGRRAGARASSCWPTGWRGGSWRWSCSWPR